MDIFEINHVGHSIRFTLFQSTESIIFRNKKKFQQLATPVYQYVSELRLVSVQTLYRPRPTCFERGEGGSGREEDKLCERRENLAGLCVVALRKKVTFGMSFHSKTAVC